MRVSSTAPVSATSASGMAGRAGRTLRLAGLTAGVTGSYLGYMAQRLFLGEEQRTRKRSAAHDRAGRLIREELQQLRGPVMKLGQALSLHIDMLPEELIAELTKLQMEAPGMHPSLVLAQFKASVGRLPEHVFKRFDADPFAAASLGQVHRAVLADGTPVAVKIQYPAIRAAIEHDFRWLRGFSLPAQASGHFPKSVMDEIESQITAETDYAREADHLEFFHAKLKSLPFVVIPHVYREYSTDRVLTMSVVPGEHIDRFLARNPSQRLRDKVGSHLLELFWFQVLILETFHADPHWGNYLFQDDGTIGLVDFGCVKDFGRSFVRTLRRSFLYPGRLDCAEFQAIIQEQFGLPRKPLTLSARRAIVDFSERFYRKVYQPDPAADDQPFDFSDAGFLRDFVRVATNLTRARGARPQYVFLGRAEVGLYTTLHKLKARVCTSAILRRLLEGSV